MNNFKDRIQDLIIGRPLACGCFLLMVLTFLLLFTSTIIKVALFATALLGFLLFLIISIKHKTSDKRNSFTAVAVVCFLVILSSLSCFLSYDLYEKNVSRLAEQQETVTLCGYPTKTVYSENFSTLYRFTVTELNDKKVYGVEILAETTNPFPSLYEIYQGEVALKVPGDTDPSFDEYTYYRRKGIHATAVCGEEFHATNQTPKTIGRLFYSFRSKLSEVIEDNTKIDSAERGILKALLIADKSDIPDEVNRNLKTLGISHILAVSGMHLSVLFVLMNKFLLLLRIPLKPRSAILGIFVLFYMALCGFTLSVVRAGIMLLIVLLSHFVNEQSDPITSLFFSGGSICLFSPYAIYDCGFLLSFFATFGLLTVGKELSGHRRMKMKLHESVTHYARASIAVSFGAQLAILPIVYNTFGYISLFSPVFTLILTPLFIGILYIAPFALCASFIPRLATVLFIPMKHLCKIAMRITELSVYSKDWTVSIDYTFTLLFVIAFVLLFLLFIFSKNKRKISVIVVAVYLLFSVIALYIPSFTKPNAVFKVNKDNDILYLYDAGSESGLIDLSIGSFSNQRLAIYYTAEASHDRNPEVIVFTHYHQRHIATFNKLCQNYYIKKLYLPKPNEKDVVFYESIISVAENYGVEVELYDEKSSFEICGYTFSDYDRQYIERSTHPVFSFKLSRGDESLRYFSSSYPEVATKDDYLIPIYFGTHGPIIKTALSERYVHHSSVFADQNVYEDYGANADYTQEEFNYFSFE